MESRSVGFESNIAWNAGGSRASSLQTSETKQGLRLERLGNLKLSLHFFRTDDYRNLQEMSSKQLGTIGRVSTESDSPTDLKAIFILHIR